MSSEAEALKNAEETLKWVPPFVGLLGVIVGGFITTFSQVFLEWRRSKRRQDAIRIALISEIETVMAVIKRRKYAAGIRDVIAQLRESPEEHRQFRVAMKENVCPIYRAHLSEIGNLPKTLLPDVLKFHMLLESVIADVTPGGLFYESFCGEGDFIDLLEMIDDLVETGERVSAQK